MTFLQKSKYRTDKTLLDKCEIIWYPCYFYRFIGKSIHGGDAIDIGPLIKGDAGKGKYAANLLYRGANISEYDAKTYEVKIEGVSEGAALTQLIDFMLFISTYEPSMSEADWMAWNARMDVDTYLRSMVLEWLTGNWDAHAYSKFRSPSIEAWNCRFD